MLKCVDPARIGGNLRPSQVVEDFGRMAERWYERFARAFQRANDSQWGFQLSPGW